VCPLPPVRCGCAGAGGPGGHRRAAGQIGRRRPGLPRRTVGCRGPPNPRPHDGPRGRRMAGTHAPALGSRSCAPRGGRIRCRCGEPISRKTHLTVQSGEPRPAGGATAVSSIRGKEASLCVCLSCLPAFEIPAKAGKPAKYRTNGDTRILSGDWLDWEVGQILVALRAKERGVAGKDKT
jgi:hypothetical protein